ncbi:protein DpdD [Mycolicibacterium arenosum]|uniref:Uncharacterized protein n=1 Tax=Mycolicibacterium arenosum TaxID=2952157 RepID=A0ABT1M5B0_9MYCO|nr:protein DpdD [Mycolicibacterium sp. CAU 1645]MCP9274055.1 hypothetical protein [Mycolicibacterium sp. CAU 1645]
MTIEAAVTDIVGDLSRFETRSDRVEGLIESQASRYSPHSSEWIVLPWRDGFYLFSEDSEGQRRGRETLVAFLGPSVVSVETVSTTRMQREIPDAAKSAGLNHASYLRRVMPGAVGADEMLVRLEDMVATLSGRVWRPLELKPTHTDLLRDFRLALLAMDSDSASRLLESLLLNGHLSAENHRFLRIEYLATFGRWTDLRALPHIEALLKSRKTQAISEILLQMVWWTELAGTADQRMATEFDERGVLQTFASLLRGVRVPATWEGRLVALLTALADGDLVRQQAICASADGAVEEGRLQELISQHGPPARENTSVDSAEDAIVTAFEDRRFDEVVNRFVQEPSAEAAAIAVQAVLETSLTAEASRVLALVREFDATGTLNFSRRDRRDLEELEQLAGNVCDGWVSWSKRIAGQARWADAGATLRDRRGSWTKMSDLSADETAAVSDWLIEAVSGTNDDQLRASLDVLCSEAATLLVRGSVNDFCQTVLLLLSEQDNFSEMVRVAYLELLTAWLDVGPSSGEYRKVLEQTSDIWIAIASPIAVSWAVGVLEATADSPCPDDAARTAFAATMIHRVRQLYGRASLRERVEIESLADDLRLPSFDVDVPDVERDVWSRLDGKTLGLYSLLPRAASLLGSRLARLCAVQVRGNDDKVATPGLRTLAERADYFIVDTWHAAHQATAAIDAVRPRHQQILPQQRGVTGFMRAVESCLAG